MREQINTKGTRNQCINLLKFISMILVILIHCKFPGEAGIRIKAFASCAVPMFFMISGYFSYRINERRILKRMQRLFADLIWANVFYFIWDIWYVYCSHESVMTYIGSLIDLKKVLVMLLFNESPLRGHLWYLGAILYCYIFLFLLTIIVRRWFKGDIAIQRLLLIAIVLLLCNIFGYYVLCHQGMADKAIILLRNWIFDGIPFFILGICIRALEDRIRKISGKIFWGALAGTFAVNLVEIFIVKPGCIIYLSTACLCTAAICVALRNSEIQLAHWAVVVGNYADQYGLLFYIVQVAVIKSIYLLLTGSAIVQSPLFIWSYPIISIVVTGVAVVMWDKLWKMCRPSVHK